MANQEHLEILNKGVDTWNNWRDKNPQITPDFRDADLSLRNLQGINLSRGEYAANLINSTLTQVDLLHLTHHHSINTYMIFLFNPLGFVRCILPG